MKFLQEVLAGVKRMQNAASTNDAADIPTADQGEGEQMADQMGNLADKPDDVDPNAENPANPDEINDEAETSEDPDKQGLIRTVKRAHLVYKREGDDGTFTELWLYNLQNLQSQTEIKRAILAGTDIPPNQLESPDGSQSYKIWAVGNVEMLEISGLPS